MEKILKITAIVMVILFIIGFSTKKILFDYSSIPEKSNISLTVDALRESAGKTGPLPVRINLLRFAKAKSQAGMVVAGQGGLKKYSLSYVLYQVVYDSVLPGGGNTIIIDAGMDRSQSKMTRTKVLFDDAKYELLQKGLKKAAAVVVTHEHFDHIGGLALSPFFNDIVGKTMLTNEQMTSPVIIEAGFTKEKLAKCKRLTYEGPYNLFPGIVVARTPGHTPGHQIVYVRLKNGTEYLLAGDIGWNMDNITMLKQKPILVSLFLGENRNNVGNQLRWLHDEIYKTHKEIRLLIHHDQSQHDEYIRQGLLSDGFE